MLLFSGRRTAASCQQLGTTDDWNKEKRNSRALSSPDPCNKDESLSSTNFDLCLFKGPSSHPQPWIQVRLWSLSCCELHVHLFIFFVSTFIFSPLATICVDFIFFPRVIFRSLNHSLDIAGSISAFLPVRVHFAWDYTQSRGQILDLSMYVKHPKPKTQTLPARREGISFFLVRFSLSSVMSIQRECCYGLAVDAFGDWGISPNGGITEPEAPISKIS